MKGTAARKLTWEQDEHARKNLEKDSKSKAENIMIVDLMRNDFSKICKENTIKTTALFQATRYRSLHQLTGKVHGKLQEGLNLNQVMKATFPPGSITGAPKIRSMEIIHQLESTPRKVYTGSMCFFMPSGDFVMNVAIRTLIMEEGKLELGIGSGIVADSAKKHEWEECFLKSTFLNTGFSFSEIFETILWTPAEGFLYQEDHIKRLKNSCNYFNIPVNSSEITQCFLDGHTFFVENQIIHGKFRLSIKQNSKITFTTEKLPFLGWEKNALRLLLSPQKTQSKNVYFYHKTDHRQFYNSEFLWAQNAGYDEVIFTNEKNELTEGSLSNLFFETLTGQWLTPKQSCGLLAGTWRAAMIKELKAKETIISLKDLKHFKNILVGNSLRKGQNIESISLKDGSIIHFFPQNHLVK